MVPGRNPQLRRALSQGPIVLGGGWQLLGHGCRGAGAVVFPSAIETISPVGTDANAAALRRWGEALEQPLKTGFGL